MGKSVPVRDAAKALNVKPRTVYRMVDRKELDVRHTKPNRGMEITLESIERVRARFAAEG